MPPLTASPAGPDVRQPNGISPTPAPATPLLTYEQAMTTYADVQGNILKGHGRDYAAFLFIEFAADPAPARTWLSEALRGDGPFRLTSTEKQLRDTRRFKQFGIPGDLFATIAFTAAGLTALGQSLPPEPTQVPLPPFTPAFARGMRAPETRTLLTDPAPGDWDAGWFGTGPDATTPTPLHALLTLADDDLGHLQRTAAAVADQLAGGVGTLHLLEWGNVLRNADNNGIEHFGYADGVSQPVYLAEDMPNHQPTSAKSNPLAEDVDRWDPSTDPEELVLVPDPAGSFGSFFVFRKLEQQVRAFKEAEEKLAHRVGLPVGDEERAGAMLVGRFEDGTPLVERSTDGLINPIVNNFNYDDDKQGLRCPFHAHIRKVNPRHETGQPDEPRRRITRRGIPYGSQQEAAKEDGKPVGLLFMCFVRSIGQQYEFMQKFWSNNASFKESGTGLDHIIGQGGRDKLRFNYAYGAPGVRQASFEQFVTLRGGEYFYAPSMSRLRQLAGANPD